MALTNTSEWRFGFQRLLDQQNLAETGGTALVITAGGTTKVPLLNASGATLANPTTITGGVLRFWTADTTDTVDLYIMLPTGHFITKLGVKRSGPGELLYDERRWDQQAIIPVNIADYTHTTEQSTGMRFIAGSLVRPQGMAFYVDTADATETIDFGLLSTESGGDADGFAALISVATPGMTQAGYTITTTWPTASTYGALVSTFTAGSGTDDRGVLLFKDHLVTSTARTVSFTFSAGTDTAAGRIIIPYRLPVTSVG